MATTGTVRKSRKQQRIDAGLGLIIEEMSRAMWNADREYMARSVSILELTYNMKVALWKFKEYCKEHYAK